MGMEEVLRAGYAALAQKTATPSTLGDITGASVSATTSIYQCDCPVRQLNTYSETGNLN